MKNSPISFGYELSHEVYDPKTLNNHAIKAEKSGFETLWNSDHFHPYFHENASCGFAWSFIPAVGKDTEKVKLGTRVTTPLGRYHPAIIAQAFATMDYMFPGRIILGLGSGEAMNTLPLGSSYPEYSDRRKVLEESLEIIHQLWNKDFVNYEGEHFSLNSAKLYTKSEKKIPIFLAAKGESSAKLAGKFADGVDTVSEKMVLEREILPSLERGAKDRDKNFEKIVLSAGLKCSIHEDYDKALESVQKDAVWLHPQIWNIKVSDPRELEKLGKEIPREKLQEEYCICTDSEKIIKKIEKMKEAGINHIVINDQSPNPVDALRILGEEVLPYFKY